MSRAELIDDIVKKSAPDFETIENYQKLAKETKYQLIKRIIHINQHLLKQL